MAAGKKSRDVVLGTGQLVGFFFLLVIVLGVVFTLGYLFGRNQYDSQIRAAGDASVPAVPDARSTKNQAAKPGKPPKSSDVASARDAEQAPPAAGADWDFYHAADPRKPEEKLAPPAPKSAKAPAIANRAMGNSGNGGTAASASKSIPHGGSASGSPVGGRSLNSPLIPRGATVLQVAALAREGDALALAQALQAKKFPAFVLAPDADKFYRVQVGPYTQAAAANAARQRLEGDGFKSIVKR